MSVLEWDKVGDRRYQTGVDRGVLFPPNSPAVPWNGLTSVQENVSREVKSYYLDGVKFLDHHVPGSYSATLSAFTYPDELDKLLGMAEYAPGIFLHDQRIKLFHLSYRTLIGNDVDGTDHGYKVHIVYNILAVPSDKAINTISDQVAVDPFEWTLSGTPNLMFGVRPTAHISLDSRLITPEALELVENLLYGTDDVDPSLPLLTDLLALVDAL
jgi:hypothetical protein